MHGVDAERLVDSLNERIEDVFRGVFPALDDAIVKRVKGACKAYRPTLDDRGKAALDIVEGIIIEGVKMETQFVKDVSEKATVRVNREFSPENGQRDFKLNVIFNLGEAVK